MEDRMYGLTKEERRIIYNRNMHLYEMYLIILQILTIVFAFLSLKEKPNFFSAVVLAFAVLNGVVLLIKGVFIHTPGYKEFCSHRKEIKETRVKKYPE